MSFVNNQFEHLTYCKFIMSNETIREFETSPRLDDETVDANNEQHHHHRHQQQTSWIDDRNQQLTVPAIVENLPNQLAIGILASTPETINVSLNVGKMYFCFISNGIVYKTSCCTTGAEIDARMYTF